MSDEIQITRNQYNKSTNIQESTVFPTEIIDLPSKGRFYDESSPLRKGTVEIKMMTAKEEDILTNPNLLKKGIAVDKVMESLVVDKTIDLDEMMSGDKDALIYAIRRLAYGDSYGPIDIKCPSCTELNKVTIDISSFEEKEIKDELDSVGNNEFKFTFPHCKANIIFKFLNGRDEKNIQLELKKMNKVSHSELSTRLRHMILSVNGNEDRNVIRDFVNKLPSRDSLAFRSYLKKVNVGIDSTFDFSCEHCGHEERSAVPMTVQFFWPDE